LEFLLFIESNWAKLAVRLFKTQQPPLPEEHVDQVVLGVRGSCRVEKAAFLADFFIALPRIGWK